MKQRALALMIGFAIDLLLGDPHSLPHPVVLMGKLISFLRKHLCRLESFCSVGAALPGWHWGWRA